MHSPEIVPLNVSGIRGICKHRIVSPHGVPAHARGKHAVQRVARQSAQVFRY